MDPEHDGGGRTPAEQIARLSVSVINVRFGNAPLKPDTLIGLPISVAAILPEVNVAGTFFA
jgi:hypothetical protein